MSLLSVSDLSKRFGGVDALSNVRFDVGAGELVGIIGPNGAGKTSLFNVLSGFLRPDRGSVRFDGRRIDHLPPERICEAGLCRTFQTAQLFSQLSVEENVLVGALCREPRVGSARAAARKLIGEVGLEAYSATAAGALSLGNRRRLELARALATRPRLLLLDEIMGGLIPAEIQAMMTLIRDVNRSGVTILLIEHIMAAVMALASRVIVLHHGERIADGPPSVIAADPAVVSAYLGEDYLLAAD